eukprot:694944-Rhodomonas_salina.5
MSGTDLGGAAASLRSPRGGGVGHVSQRYARTQTQRHKQRHKSLPRQKFPVQALRTPCFVLRLLLQRRLDPCLVLTVAARVVLCQGAMRLVLTSCILLPDALYWPCVCYYQTLCIDLPYATRVRFGPSGPVRSLSSKRRLRA